MKLTKGKIDGLEAASRAGVIAAAAMDQRSPLAKAIAREKNVDESTITAEMLSEFKAAVARIITPHTSAILLDPEVGLEAARVRAKNAGLLLAYEQTWYDHQEAHRFPRLLPDWSVRRLKAAGAQGIKILLFYTPFDDPQVNERKKIWVERIGAECAAEDIPYFLEFIGYDPQGADPLGPEFAKLKPKIVIASIEEFSRPEYRVDVLKVEIPVNLQYVEGTRAFGGTQAQTRKEALDYFQEAASAATKPFIYLSAGVTNPEFTEGLGMAAEAGAKFNGVLCGRATWKDGIPAYAKGGVRMLEEFLKTEGLKNVAAINECLKAAVPWYWAYGARDAYLV